MTDPYKCGRCGLPVSPGVCAPQPHVFHDRPEHCVADLVLHVTKLRAALTVILHGRCDPQDAARRALDDEIVVAKKTKETTMPSENMRTMAREWLYNSEYPNECASQQEVDDLATLLDKVREDAAVEQWGKDQSGHHGTDTVTCQPCIRMHELLRDARSLIDTMNGNIQRQTSAEIRDHVSYAVCQDMIRRIDALERSVRVGADASPSPEPLRPSK